MAKIIWRPPTNEGQSGVEGEPRSVVAMDRAEKDDKLEIKVEEAWFAAEISLGEDGMTNVHYENFSDGDEQWDAEKINSFKPIHEHIRVVSEQLQDAECGIVSVNMIVCAFRRVPDQEGWYDAKVTEVRKRLHTVGVGDDNELCTCSFTVIWIEGPDKGKTGRNLTCADICVPSTKDVQTHPIVLDILRCARGLGRGLDQEDEEGLSWATTSSSSYPENKRRKRDTDDDYTPSLEEQIEDRRIKRLKSKARQEKGFSQVNEEEIFPLPDPSEEQLELVDGYSPSTSTEKREGLKSLARQSTCSQVKTDEIVADTDPNHVDQKLELDVDHTVCTSTEKGEIQDGVFLSSASALSDMGLSSHAAQLIRAVASNIYAGRDPLAQSEQLIDATKIRDVPSVSAHSAEDNRPKKKMRGQVESESSVPSDLSALRERILGTRSTDRGCKDQVEQRKTIVPNAKSSDSFCKSQVQQKTATSPNVEPLPERRAKTKVIKDVTKEAKCEVQVKKETKPDSLEGRQLSGRSSEVQVKDEDVKVKVDSLEENHLSSKPSVFSATDKEQMAEAEALLMQQKAENLAATNEARCLKKLRITVEFDVENEFVSIVEGVSLNRAFPGAKVTSFSSNYEDEGLVKSGGKSGAWATTVKAAGLKSEEAPSVPAGYSLPEPKDEEFLKSSIEREGGSDNRWEELRGSVDSFGKPEKKNSSIQPELEEDESKVRMYSRRARSSKEELVDSKSNTRLGLAAKNAICLSDEEEEEESVIAGSSIPPTPSTRDEQQSGWNVHLQNNRARSKRSVFIKSVLTKSGCILTIDNLEVCVRESDLREQLLQFCDKEKIQSVTIPPPHPPINRVIGYVIFVDREAADAAADVLASCIIVSARGRPWVVKRQGQEELNFRRKSDWIGNYHDVNALSSKRFRVLTKKQQSEYNAARKRLRVFEEHRKQLKVMFQRHDQEQKKLDADPAPSLYR